MKSIIVEVAVNKKEEVAIFTSPLPIEISPHDHVTFSLARNRVILHCPSLEESFTFLIPQEVIPMMKSFLLIESHLGHITRETTVIPYME